MFVQVLGINQKVKKQRMPQWQFMTLLRLLWNMVEYNGHQITQMYRARLYFCKSIIKVIIRLLVFPGDHNSKIWQKYPLIAILCGA